MSGERGHNFWRGTLKGARLVVAPMVDASELPWRLLSRRYGAELCYTPMLHAHVFVKDARYRRENLASCAQDRPLIVQFCANDPETFVAACKLASPHCDAVDLNLGCPQAIARKGHYGAFLQDEWDLVKDMIARATSEVSIPVTAKIRVFDDVAKTVEYARLLESAGASLLTVHGRTRAQKGPLTGLASWDHIKAVKDAVSIPVLANGNIQFLDDVWRCLSATGVEGVMSAEGNLHNPALFIGTHPPVWQVAQEYLTLVQQYPCPPSYARGHIFKLLHHCLSMPENFDIRHRLSKTSTTAEMVAVVKMLKERMEPYYSGDKPWTPEPDSEQARLPFPPWKCQPYVRISPEQHLKKVEESRKRAEEKAKLQQEEEEGGLDKDEGSKRPIAEEAEEEEDLSKKKKKKMVRNPQKSFTGGEQYDKCACKNPKGGRCAYSLCRKCCRVKCYTLALDCPGHRILVKTKREKASIYYGQLKREEQEKAQQQQESQGGEDLPEGRLSAQAEEEAQVDVQDKKQENKLEKQGPDTRERQIENKIDCQEELKSPMNGVSDEKKMPSETEENQRPAMPKPGKVDDEKKEDLDMLQDGNKASHPDKDASKEEYDKDSAVLPQLTNGVHEAPEEFLPKTTEGNQSDAAT